MKKNICLFLTLLLCSSCNVIPTDTTESGGDLRFFKWMKFEIINNTYQSADIYLSGITMIFDTTNDVRTLDAVILPSYNIGVVEAKDMHKFEQAFDYAAKEGTLYETGADSGNPCNPDDVAAMNYVNPVDRLFIAGECKKVLSVQSNIAAHSRQIYYCDFEPHYNRWDQSAIESVRINLTIGTQKISLLGWDQSEFTLDDSTDDYNLYNLDIWNDNLNPSKDYSGKSKDTWSQSLRCYYCEETIEINGDTTADIVVTQNCVNPY